MRSSLLLAMVSWSACVTAPTPPAPAAVSAAPIAVKPALVPPTVRLPAGARPTSYRLAMTVLPGRDTFSGTLSADVEVSTPLEVLWLNATRLTPGSASFLVGGQNVPATTEVFGEHFLALVPATPLPVGLVTLNLTWTGELSRKDNDGLFQLKEGDEWYAYTTFEPIDARRAFPHFDEPQFKVPWELTLTVPATHAALSNTKVLSETPAGEGLKVVRFEKTPPLPSYLLAFAVGPFEFVDAGRHGKKKTPVRIVVPKGKTAEAKYAALMSGPVLDQLEQWFGSAYPYEKLDQLAIPTAMGAMENPGLVTYGHQIILAKPELDTPGRQRSFTSVCTHELAHQWFGDLVTMAFWDDLWLNEAFATWMTTRVLEQWQPTWAMDVVRVNRRNGALGADALVNARRIRQPITANDDIANAFDGITYSKGASVIGMFEAWVGRETFQRGVRAYLVKHAWGNATATDFLAAISEAAGRDVGTPFRTFLDQPGGPAVQFTLSCPAEQTPSLALAQKRSLPVGSTGDAAKTWQVPVCVRWSAKGKPGRACTVLTQSTGTLALEGATSCPDWVVPNEGYEGYYRANLVGPVSLVDTFAKGGAALSAPERVGLLGDLLALVRSGDVDLADALVVAELASKANDRHVLGYAMSLASQPGGDLLPEALRQKHEAWVRRLFSKKLGALGLSPKKTDDEDTRFLRTNLVGTMGWVGKDQKLMTEARRLTLAWLMKRDAVHPDLLDTVLMLGGEGGDAGLHGKLLAAAKAETDRADRGRLLGALAEFTNPALVSTQLPLVLTDTFDTRESMRLLWSATGDFRTRALGLAFLEAHWDELIARLPKDAGASLVWMASSGCDEKARDEARTFFEGRSTKYLGGPRSFAQAMEGIDLCIAWRARQRPSAVRFFEKH